MEAFYEESSISRNAKGGERKYKILNYCSYFFLAIAIIILIYAIAFVPIADGWGAFLVTIMAALMFAGFWFLFYRLKSHSNVSYDYCFVSGELRIARVININRRRLVAKFEVEDIIQIGDVESPSFDRFHGDPTIKTVFCTSNVEADEGKFFMYILANYEGKKLFILECREALLMNVMKFAKRTALDRDYVMQEKKQK